MLSKIAKTSFVKKSLISLALLVLSIFAFGISPAHAEPYGSGSYGECKYGQSCPATTSTPSSSGGGGSNTTTKTPTVDGSTLLNDFTEYTNGDGKQLDLSKDQKVSFDITKNEQTSRYVVTVKEVGEGYAIITVGNDPTEVRMAVGDTRRFDVNGDGINDIEVTLVAVSNGKATFKFKAFVLDANTTNTPKETPASTTAQDSKGFNWLLIASIGFLGIGLIWTLVLFAKRRKKDKS